MSYLYTVSDIVEAITPHKLLGLRQLLNSSAMDIMYYTSPLYGCEVRCESGLVTDMCLNIL
jgi:phospholipase DDHD1